MCSCVAGVKQGEPGHFLNVSKRSRAQQLTHTFVAVIMHLKCAVGTESAFAGGVFVKRAAKSHVYYGELCECSDFSCDQYRGLQCGGIVAGTHLQKNNRRPVCLF